MKISIESTDQVIALNGVPARVWQGTTAGGVKVQAFITRIALDRSDAAACEQFARELKEHVPPEVEWPVFMIIDTAPQRCRVCGCTDDDCSQCIAKTGMPCSWVEGDLCSACVSASAEMLTDAQLAEFRTLARNWSDVDTIDCDPPGFVGRVVARLLDEVERIRAVQS